MADRRTGLHFLAHKTEVTLRSRPVHALRPLRTSVPAGYPKPLSAAKPNPKAARWSPLQFDHSRNNRASLDGRKRRRGYLSRRLGVVEANLVCLIPITPPESGWPSRGVHRHRKLERQRRLLSGEVPGSSLQKKTDRGLPAPARETQNTGQWFSLFEYGPTANHHVSNLMVFVLF